MDGNFAILKDGQTVAIWDSDDKAVSEDLGISLGQYLEQIRDGLLSNKLAYDEDLGIYSQK